MNAGKQRRGKQRRGTGQTAREKKSRRGRKTRGICLAAAVLGLIAAAAIGYGRENAPVAAGETPPQTAVQTLQYPESLGKLMEMNPETEDFVRGYFDNRDRHYEIDLSDEVEKGTIPLFLQWDERWGYETYGSDFMAVTGCGPTCLSMVYCGLSGETDWDPLRTAQFAWENGYYVPGSGTAWDLMTDGADRLGLTVEEVVFDADHILAQLRGGSPVICAMRPGDFTTTGHFIVLAGVDGEGRVIVRDPNSRANSGKTWDIGELIPQIKNLWAYRW